MDQICKSINTGQSLYNKGCSDCVIGNVPDSTDEDYDDFKNKKRSAIIIISLITILFVLYFVYITFSGIEKSIFTKVKEFYGSSFTQLTFSLVIVFLVSDVINSFNSNIMNPVVSSILPGGDIWETNVCLPRGEFILPGIFLKTVISFTITIGLVFILGELFGKFYTFFPSSEELKSTSKKSTSKLPIINQKSQGFVYFIIVGLFIALIVWNIVEIKDEKSTIFRVNEEEGNILFKNT